MRTVIVLLYLVGGISYVVQAVRIMKNDQDNFQWISKILRGDTNRQSDCDCECGKAKVKRNPFQITRIVGGQEAKKHSHPWMAGLMYEGLIFCGGSLISSKYILSAAHCIVAPKEDITIRLGAHDVNKDTEKDYKDYDIEEVILHEDYDEDTNINDIAVIKVKGTIEMSDNVMPICLPNKKDYVGTEATVIGWGRISNDGDPSPFLKEVNLPVISQQKCKEFLGPYLTDKMLCAGFDKGGKDSCEGDSGGPLLHYNSDTQRNHLIGVISFGVHCAYPGEYGVYTDCSKYLDWIKDKTKDGCYCKSP